MIIKGNMKYDNHGRKRKVKAVRATRKPQEWKTFEPTDTYKRTTKQYPSLSMGEYKPQEDKSYQQEVSKQYTVSIAYNKGAYQVIPKKDIKHIGK
jgi:hypothetical protein